MRTVAALRKETWTLTLPICQASPTPSAMRVTIAACLTRVCIALMCQLKHLLMCKINCQKLGCLDCPIRIKLKIWISSNTRIHWWNISNYARNLVYCNTWILSQPLLLFKKKKAVTMKLNLRLLSKLRSSKNWGKQSKRAALKPLKCLRSRGKQPVLQNHTCTSTSSTREPCSELWPSTIKEPLSHISTSSQSRKIRASP